MTPSLQSASLVVLFCCVLMSFTDRRSDALAAAVEERAAPPDARQVLNRAIRHWADIVEPPAGTEPLTFEANFKVVRADGLPPEAEGALASVAFLAPAHLHLSAIVNGTSIDFGRAGNELWIREPAKHFSVLGRNGIAPFSAEPDVKDHTMLPPFALPLPRWQLATAAMMFEAELAPDRELEGAACYVLRLKPRAATTDLLRIPPGQIELCVRKDDYLPTRIEYSDGAKTNFRVEVHGAKLVAPTPAQHWNLDVKADDAGEHVETVALSHLVKFLHVTPRIAFEKAPVLGPASGDRRVIATEGRGRLEMIDGTRVLFLKGSPREMGRQQGVLLNAEIHDVAERILYGVGVGSSFQTGRWFFGEVERAEAELEPHMDPRYLQEMDAIADACGMDRQESRLANFFPELFHCSGFALMGKATKDGHMFHGRVLDYLRGVGLEQNAVVMVYQPDYGNAWVNLGYAGFVGTVTAMNEKGISIGEMGGRHGYGEWDGKPMAHLLREVMEKASTLDEAIQIMRTGPRTCEYYYVISDGKSHRAVGIYATPTKFLTIQPGEFNPDLPHPMPDAVMLSAGQRYETLASRVKAGYGAFDAESAIHLMDPPVCMTSNIQSVLFAPDTLDMWVANADGQHVASQTRYTHYNLRDLLKSEAPPKQQEKTARAKGPDFLWDW